MSKMKVVNNTIGFWQSIFDLFSNQGAITVPNSFHDQNRELKKYLYSDTSAIVNTLLDYYISCALVDIKIECSNSSVKSELNDWLNIINEDLRGKKVEVGIQGLARQYFRERWKGSSLMLARSLWEDKNGLNLPTTIWFVDGASLKINSDKENAIIGKEQYILLTKTSDNKNEIILPKVKNEQIFVQSPYSSWGVSYPTPFLVQRGILHNMKFMDSVSGQIEKIIAKALPYMLLMKKGTEALALQNKVNYSNEDLKQLQMNFADFKEKAATEPGMDTLFTNFDTEMEHFFPDYSKILKGEVFAPIERRLLEGLGMIEIVEGVGTTRREAIFNPKPMLREIKQGVNDFSSLLKDIIITILNKNSKRNLINDIKIITTPVEDSITENLRDHFRRMYERGILSKQTYSEVCGGEMVDYSMERKRRIVELKSGDEILMFPQQIQNTEQNIAPEEENRQPIGNKEDIDEDKKGTDKQDYVASEVEIAKDLDCSQEELAKIYESAPYKSVDDLSPKIKKVLEPKLQKTFINIFNTAYEKYKNEQTAFKVAWSVINRIAEKDKEGIWHRKKAKGSYEQSLVLALLEEVE